MISRFCRISLVVMGLALLSSLAAREARAQDPLIYTDYIRTELDWYTIETEHFQVHFHGDETG